MARNISFALTTEQFKNKTKTVTRRLGWKFLEPGDILMACEKCQGLKKGEKIKRLGKIRVTNVAREYLYLIAYEKDGCKKEGFPNMTPVDFMKMFCTHMKCHSRTEVTRIEFEYL